MNKRTIFSPIPIEEAFPLWNHLASTNSANPTHAHNPHLFTFYTQYLKLTTYYLIIYNQNQPIALLPLTSQPSTSPSPLGSPAWLSGGVGFQRLKFQSQPSTSPSPLGSPAWLSGGVGFQRLKFQSQPSTSPSPLGRARVGSNRQQLFSLPHLSYGGICWLNESHPDDESVLHKVSLLLDQTASPAGFYRVHLEEAHLITENSQAEIFPQIQVRSTVPVLKHTEQKKAVYWMTVENDPRQQMEAFSSNLRRKIKASGRKGVEVSLGGIELLSDFMPIYRQNLHHLGSPALGFDFFQYLLQACKKEEATLAIAYHQGQPIGGGLWLSYHGFCENTHFATLTKHNHQYTSYALHWAMIQHVRDRGDHTYSFGRSTTGSTVEKFKTQWPAEVHPLYYNSTYPIVNRITSKTWLSKIWKYLPSFLVNAIGPSIAKRIY